MTRTHPRCWFSGRQLICKFISSSTHDILILTVIFEVDNKCSFYSNVDSFNKCQKLWVMFRCVRRGEAGWRMWGDLCCFLLLVCWKENDSLAEKVDNFFHPDFRNSNQLHSWKPRWHEAAGSGCGLGHCWCSRSWPILWRICTWGTSQADPNTLHRNP